MCREASAWSRCEFLVRNGRADLPGSTAMAVGPGVFAAERKKQEIINPNGKAERCIFFCLGGGVLKTGLSEDVTVDLAKKIVGRPISVPDLHATIHCALGINPKKFLCYEGRPVSIADRGLSVRAVFG